MYYGPNGAEDFQLAQCLNHEEDKNSIQYSTPSDKIHLVMQEKGRVPGGTWEATRKRLLAVFGSKRKKTVDCWLLMAEHLPDEVHSKLKLNKTIPQARLLNKFMTGKASAYTDASKFRLRTDMACKCLDLLVEERVSSKRFRLSTLVVTQDAPPWRGGFALPAPPY
jgi:hypothetical protein